MTERTVVTWIAVSLAAGCGDGDGLGPDAEAVSPKYVQLAAGARHNCALDETGQAYCWGFGGLGGPVTEQHSPTAITGGFTFYDIRTMGEHSCGLASGGVVYCWGRNVTGQLGDGTTTGSAIPVRVLDP